MQPLDREQVEAKVLEAIAEVANDPSLLSRDATLEALDISSLDLVEITQILEDEFDIEILGQDREEGAERDMTTVGDAVDTLVNRIQKVRPITRG